jgi:N utilization substance protein B
MKTTSRARNNARLYAVQALYQRRIAETPFDEMKIQFHADNADRHETDWTFFYRLIDSVRDNDEEIEQLISENSKDGNLDLMNFVDVSVLKVAVSELIECRENPYQIIIKEYVEIAYNMGTDKGYLFVNGLLQNLSKIIRPLEYKEREATSNIEIIS